jgi:hypothetical protein
MVNKRGWIRIIEAFIAVLLISVFVLIAIDGKKSIQEDFSSEIYTNQISILKEIQLNSSLRNEILNLETLPLEGENLPESIKNKINEKKLGVLNCTGKICEIGLECELENYEEKEIYVESLFISSNYEKFAPRQLKLFCWRI